jgi:hypothetical protein
MGTTIDIIVLIGIDITGIINVTTTGTAAGNSLGAHQGRALLVLGDQPIYY